MKVYHGKIGTIPGAIQLRYNYKIEPGKIVLFRKARFYDGRYRSYDLWVRGKITRVDPDTSWFNVVRC